MIDVQALTNKIWAQDGLPNNIKTEWAAVCNEVANVRVVPSQPWLRIDFVNQRSTRYNELKGRMERYRFSWVKDAMHCLNYWLMDLSMLI
jgi:hypothetical protein